MNYDFRVKMIYEGLKDSHDAAPFTNLATEIDTILDNFFQSSRSILDNVKSSCINNVGDEFGNLYTSVETTINNLKLGTEKINNVAPNVPAIYSACEAHIKAVDSYNEAVANISSLEKNKPTQSSHTDEEGVTRRIPDDSTFSSLMYTWTTSLNSWRQGKISAEETAKAKKSEVDSLAATIIGILSAISSAGAGTIGSSGFSDPNSYQIKLADGMTKNGNKVIDENGNLLSENYQIIDENGNVIENFSATYTYGSNGAMQENYTYERPDSYIQSGVAIYNSDGNRTQDKYQLLSVNGDYRNGTVFYGNDGKKVSEEYASSYINGNSQNGKITYDEDGIRKLDDYYLTAADGSKRDGYISYDSKGNIETDTYQSTFPSGSRQDGTVKYRNDGSIKSDNYRLIDSSGNKKNGKYLYDRDGHMTRDEYTLSLTNDTSITGHTEYYDNGMKKEEYKHFNMENGRPANRVSYVKYDSNGNLTF